MGNLVEKPTMPSETHIGYIEGFLDAIEKIEKHRERHPEFALEDAIFIMRASMRYFIIETDYFTIPDDLTAFPSTRKLLEDKKRYP